VSDGIAAAAAAAAAGGFCCCWLLLLALGATAPRRVRGARLCHLSRAGAGAGGVRASYSVGA
jgi:hypothetical protein